MTDTLTTEDVQSQTAERGSDGDLLPEQHTIQWGDDEKEVETVPITTGVLNELSHIDDAIADLKPSAVHEAFQTIYVTPDPDSFTEADIRDLHFTYLEALMTPLDEEMDEDIGRDESGNPVEMSKGERAREMRQ